MNLNCSEFKWIDTEFHSAFKLAIATIFLTFVSLAFQKKAFSRKNIFIKKSEIFKLTSFHVNFCDIRQKSSYKL